MTNSGLNRVRENERVFSQEPNLAVCRLGQGDEEARSVPEAESELEFSVAHRVDYDGDLFRKPEDVINSSTTTVKRRRI